MMRRAFAALVGLLMVIVLAACSDGVSLPGFGGSGGVERDPALAGGTLRIAAATERGGSSPCWVPGGYRAIAASAVISRAAR